MSEDLTIIMDLPDGPFYRTIRAAAPLPPDADRGPATEQATRFAAARWGMPDFVFNPVHLTSGSGVREIGDGLIVAGRTAIMMQSKSRQSQEPENEDRARNWLDKNIAKGFRQGEGSIRFLKSTPSRMENRRGRSATVDGGSFNWINLVIVDYPHIPDDYEYRGLASNAIVLSRRDWEFLFDQLRSTHYVADYLHRVAGETHALDMESIRYFELAQADLAAEPKPLPEWATGTALTVSVPRAPMEHQSAAETRAHLILRVIQEDIALSSLPEGSDALDMADVLIHIDSIPLPSRSELGARILDGMRQAHAHDGDSVLTNTRIYLPMDLDESPGPVLFMVASSMDAHVKAMFSGRTQLQHIDFMAQTGEDVMTTGVLLTPGTSSGRAWETTMTSMRGDLGADDEYAALLRAAVESATDVESD